MKKTIIGVLLALFVMLMVSLFFNYKQYRDAKDTPATKVETKIEYRDTAIQAPQATFEKPVGTISAKVAKPVQNRQEPVNMMPDTDSSLVERYEPPNDSITIELPRTQKVYTDDSTYTAYVSGYEPNLDSIRIRRQIVTNTITIRDKAKQRKINVGLIGGYGYGFKSKQVEPFIGIGISINLF